MLDQETKQQTAPTSPEAPVNPTPHRDAIAHEAKVAGLKDFRLPTLEAIEGRRLQLWC